MEKLGNWVQGYAEIPAGGDAYIVHRLLTAGDKPIRLQAGTWWGGDSNEYIALALLQPNQIGIGEKEISHFIQQRTAIPIFEGNIDGGLSENEARAMFGAYIRVTPGTVLTIPPHCSVVMYATTANTAAWHVIIGGFECEEYA